MEWSPQDAMEAYLQTLHLNKACYDDDNRHDQSRKSVIEPECMELISALAAGKRAKQIVEITTQGITPLTVALGVAAKQSGGQLICIHVGKSKNDLLMKDKLSQYCCHELQDVIRLVAGKPFQILMQLKNIDFAIIDCNFDDYLKLFCNLDVNLTSSTVIVRNVHQRKAGIVSFAQVIKKTKGVKCVTLPIGDGIELTRIGSLSADIRGKRQKRFLVIFEN